MIVFIVNRTILLKLATICVYVVVLYTEVKCLTDAADKNCDKVCCMIKSDDVIKYFLEFLHFARYIL